MLVQILGPLRVLDDDGVDCALGGFRQRVVMALLALHRERFVGAEQLIDEVWGDDPPGRPRKTLQVYVANLRRVIGAHHIRSGFEGYRLLIADEACDAAVFAQRLAVARQLRDAQPAEAVQAYESALHVWAGPALPELNANPVVAASIRPLAEERDAARAEQATLQIATGGGGDLVPELLRRIEEDPWREQTWGLLMQAYYAAGRQADALAAYQDLRHRLSEDLGVEPSPALRTLQGRILRQDLGSADPVTAAPRPTVTIRPSAPRAGERRNVTVLTCGIADWDELVADGDPEDLDRRHHHVHKLVSQVVSTHGGRLLDGADGSVSAAFGFPEAAPDDPLRAVRAALELGASSGLRIAVATGPAWVDEHTGLSCANPGRSAMLIQARSAPGQVLVCAETAAAVAGRFRFGAAEPTSSGGPVIPVLAETEAESLPDTLVGRESELAAAERVLRQRGPVAVLLHGEPGIGKSAVLGHLLSRRPDAANVVALPGHRHRRSTALAPVGAALRQRYPTRADCECDLALLGVPEADRGDLAYALDRLAQWGPTTTQTPDDNASTTAVGSLPLRTAAATWLQCLGRAGTLWVVVDDLQDVDQETRLLLAGLVDEVDDVVVALTSHTTALPTGWRVPTTTVELGRLSRPAAQQLVVSAAPHHLRLRVVERILRAAAGHPLHLTVLARNPAYAEDGPATRPVPVGLEAGLRADLDRLGPLRDLARRCAVVGTSLTRDLVRTVAHDILEPTDLDRAMAALAASGLLVEVSTDASQPCYRFAHELIERVAHQSLPRALREQLHARVAEQLAASPRAEYEDLARHLELAGTTGGAVRAWTGGGSVRLRQGRHVDAVAAIRRALDLLPRAGLPTEEAEGLELQGCVILVQALSSINRYHEDLAEACARAVRLARRLDRPDLQTYADLARIAALQAVGDYAAADELGHRTLATAARASDPRLYRAAMDMHASTRLWTGRLIAARELFDVDSLLEVDRDRVDASSRFAVATSLAMAAFADFVLGERVRSESEFSSARSVGAAGDDPATACAVDLIEASAWVLDGDVERARALADRTMDRTLECASDWFYLWCQTIQGWATAIQHDPEAGLRVLGEVARFAPPRCQFGAFLELCTAQALLRAGRFDEALSAAQRAVTRATSTGERVFLPYAYTMAASLALIEGRPGLAADYRHQAGMEADRQGNRHLQHRPAQPDSPVRALV